MHTKAGYFANLKEMPKGQNPQGLEGSLCARYHRTLVHFPLLFHVCGKLGIVNAQPPAHLTRRGCLVFTRPKPANPCCKLNVCKTGGLDALPGTTAVSGGRQVRPLLAAQHRVSEAGRAACALKHLFSHSPQHLFRISLYLIRSEFQCSRFQPKSP